LSSLLLRGPVSAGAHISLSEEFPESRTFFQLIQMQTRQIDGEAGIAPQVVKVGMNL
jgi:hypothetical protein